MSSMLVFSAYTFFKDVNGKSRLDAGETERRKTQNERLETWTRLNLSMCTMSGLVKTRGLISRGIPEHI